MPDLKVPSTLVVVVHGYSHDPASMAEVANAVSACIPGAQVIIPALPTQRYSLADPSELAVTVLKAIDKVWDETPFERIILVGHSLGALIARKVFVVAAGELREAPFDEKLRRLLKVPENEFFPGRRWARQVERIVLLAAVNRGWRVSHHLSLIRAPLWAVGALMASIIRLITTRNPLIMSIHRGAEFITNLRIQWITLCNVYPAPPVRPPLTIQLLGSRDDLVSPQDNVDLASGSDFVYLDVPMSDHSNIIAMAGSGAPAGRRAVFQRALTFSKNELDREAVIPSDDAASKPDTEVTDVVFVIHGIRDVGYWTHKIARKVRALGECEREEKLRLGQKPRKWATETSSYGYFAMLPFLLPFQRRHKVEWMMDQYAEALARYPRATFHYVGHSHGTYLLAKALKLYPACRFGRVVFAGSVVRCRYKWSAAIERAQVKHVLNFVATSDWVVAFFPKLFEFLPVQDLGSAGHDGFKPEKQNGLTQLTFVRGGHSAAIKEELWNTIAEFIASDVPRAEAPEGALTTPRSWWVVVLGWIPFVVWLGIAAAIGGLWYLINNGIDITGTAWLAGFSSALFAFLVLLILRRV